MQKMPESSGTLVLLLFSPFMIIEGLVMGQLSVAGEGVLFLVIALLRHSQINK